MMYLLLSLASAAEPPGVHATGFTARDGGLCTDRAAARRGECLDRVDLLDLDRAWSARPARGEDRAAWKVVSELYAHTWEDLARRWSLPDVEQTVVAEGFTELPPPSRIWEQSEVSRGSYALPPRRAWLGVGTWFDPVAAPDSPRDARPIYSHVRYHGPEGQEPMPRTLLLAGRFAERLGFDGKRHDYDIMDGDSGSSGPFFEQVFPYQRKLSAAREAEDPVYAAAERRPLTDFRFPRHLVDSTEDPFAAIRAFDEAFGPVTTSSGLPGARAIAHDQFERFVRVVSVAAAQYAMQDVTRNQMRVLAAITAMASPPSSLEKEGGYTRDLVAAARGETDTSEEILERFDQQAIAALPDGQHIRYERLPRQVVEPWVARLVKDAKMDSAFFDVLNADLLDVFPAILRPDRPRLSALDVSHRRGWLRDSVLPGNDREEVEAELLRIALRRMIEQLPEERQDRIETWMLVDQALDAISTTFEEGREATPNEIVEAATTQWQVVLALHDHATQRLAQGLGAVDPTAICSTADGLEGLDEPSFRRVDVDQLVAAKPGLSPEQILVEASGTMPFVMIDDPEHNAPEVVRLVGLGDGRDLYRVRWSVWTGWHLLWDVTPAADGKERVILRTGAFCDDMVLASPDLTPTLVRAGLLVANFRPTTPEKGRVPDVHVETPDAEGVSSAITAAPDAAAGAKGKLEDAKGLLNAGTLESMAGNKPGVGPSAYEVKLEDLRPEVTYVRDLVWGPLTDHLGSPSGLLFVADVGPPDELVPTGSFRPRTPYETATGHTSAKKASDEDAAGRFRASGWMWLRRAEQRPVQVAPAFAPKDTDTDRPPRWARRNTADFGLVVGAGMFPWRAVTYACADPQPGVADDCIDPGTVRTEGFSGDVQALGTLWRHGRRVLGVDAGLEARLDVRHAGPSWFWKGDTPTDFNFTLRPAAGMVVGVRAAPAPGPLWRYRSNRSTWGTPRGDGPVRLGRTQHGLRASVLIGPGFNGLESTLGLEGWKAWSRRRTAGPRASFTPWHPGFLIGPYVRGQLGIPLTDGADAGRYLTLQRSATLIFGIRTHLRLAEPAPEPPEIE